MLLLFFLNCKLYRNVYHLPSKHFSYLQISRYHDYQKIIKIKPLEFCAEILLYLKFMFNARKPTYSLNSSKMNRSISTGVKSNFVPKGVPISFEMAKKCAITQTHTHKHFYIYISRDNHSDDNKKKLTCVK